jgi:ABC-type transport system involved in cytochrome bd biosynthesis fused ATPase/permease subunit
MAGKLDTEIQEMNAKLTGLPDTAARERDRANKEFNAARAQLKSQLADLRSGTADTWVAAKGKVAQAWQRMQAAYDKVKSSPTS